MSSFLGLEQCSELLDILLHAPVHDGQGVGLGPVARFGQLAHVAQRLLQGLLERLARGGSARRVVAGAPGPLQQRLDRAERRLQDLRLRVAELLDTLQGRIVGGCERVDVLRRESTMAAISVSGSLSCFRIEPSSPSSLPREACSLERVVSVMVIPLGVVAEKW